MAKETPLDMITLGDRAIDIDDLTMEGGFGTLTSGPVNVVQGEVKSFGTAGQGTSTGMGY